MDAIGDGCLLCRLGWRMKRGPKGELVDSLEIDGKTIRLCRHHDKLVYGTEEDRKEARRVMAPYIFEGRSHEVYLSGKHAGKRKE